MAVEEHPVDTGRVRVATRESTLIDLVVHPEASGGLSNVATVIEQIGDLDVPLLARLASLRSRSVSRRLGWLLARYRKDLALDPCARLRSRAASTRHNLYARYQRLDRLTRHGTCRSTPAWSLTCDRPARLRHQPRYACGSRQNTNVCRAGGRGATGGSHRAAPPPELVGRTPQVDDAGHGARSRATAVVPS
jgi:hypothetical protein